MPKLPSKTTMINKLDKVVPKIIKARDNNVCQMCGKQVFGTNCQWSHIITRRTKHMRWDLENSLVLCYYCHRRWHSSPLESKEWFAQKFPERDEYLMKEKNNLKPLGVLDMIEIYEQLASQYKHFLS